MKRLHLPNVIKNLKNHFLQLLSMVAALCPFASLSPDAPSPEQRKTQLLSTLKRNWYIPFSALAFFCLNATTTPGYFAGGVIAFIASVVIALQIPAQYTAMGQARRWMQVVAILTALGICWNIKDALSLQLLAAPLSVLPQRPRVVLALDVLSFPFVYFCVLLFWRKMAKVFSEIKVLDGITKAEWVVYGILLAASLTFMGMTFVQTEAFRGRDCSYDLIYTSDSPLEWGNSFLVLTHAENDIRQPLFAVFAAPFVGIPYLLGKLLGGSMTVQAISINIVQVIMLFFANFMVAKMIRLNAGKRICFLILTSCTYTYLLFILMMDQYIVAYFWLILCIYWISQNQQPDRIALWGAGGTLLTSMILLPFMSAQNPVRNFKAWFADMVKYGLEFVGVMLVFCRFDVIYNAVSQLSKLHQYNGNILTFTDKLYQYTAFLSGCFAAPDAGERMNVDNLISWQLRPVTSIHFLGIGILLLAVVSVIVNRKKRSSLVAAGWVVFSAVILLGMGWGTAENGLILYALYFGWALLVLLFQLVEKIADKLNVQFLVPVFSIGCAAALAVINIPAIMELVNFAITNYPT